MEKFINKPIVTMLVVFVVLVVLGLVEPNVVNAASPATVNLGTAGNFAVLSKAKVTTTGATSITGDVGISPAAASILEGFSQTLDGSGQFSTSTYVTGKIYAADYTAPTPSTLTTAVSAMEAAYTDASGRSPDELDRLGGTLPLGTTFVPGIYKWGTDVNITGDITLLGSATDVWIFIITGNLDISSAKSVLLSGGAIPANVFWAVAGTTTLETTSTFVGNILAGPATSTIAMLSGATLYGRALGQKNITLIADTISISSPATLTLVKTITNDNGGARTVADFPLTAAGPTTISGVSGTGPVKDAAVTAGLYTLSETTRSDYTSGLWSCTNGITVTSSQITLTSGQSTVCTINNNDKPAHLIVIKQVVNDNTGAALASAFSTTIAEVTTATPTAAGVESPGVDNILTSVGSYSVDEGAHVGYDKTLSADCSGTIALGETKTCTITNNDIPPGTSILHVIKHVINDNGGAAAAGAWNLAVTSSDLGSGTGNAAGAESPGTTYTLQAGKAYNVAESGGSSGYSSSLSNDCAIVNAVASTTYTCTITNNDIAPSLHLRKTVDNTGGGAALDTAWTLTATGAGSSPTNLTGTTPVDSSTTFKVDTYTLAESGAPAGYTAGLWVCVGGAQIGSAVSVALGESATCTIKNTFISATTETITVIKAVVGGAKDIGDFPLLVSGLPVTSGDTNSFSAPASYTVTETSKPNYTASFSGDCPGGIVNLTLGTPKICTITNTYIAPSSGGGGGTPPVPPLIDLVKVPDPLALPAGPGSVTYTYTLKNIGTVPVTNITMVGDTCAPIILVSGDTNINSNLDVNETWIYTCSTTLTKTHTNIVTATGWANGISAVDVASATVVVGAPVIPPLIHMTKVPSVFALAAPGGAVTYTYTVTNPGTAPLSDVGITDDKCTGLPGRVVGHPGDLNKNNLLESNETWTFTCQTKLTKTTTNTGTAVGSANGLTARDFAIATVVVAAPGFPDAGFPPTANSAQQGMFILAVIFLLVSISLVKTSKIIPTGF